LGSPPAKAVFDQGERWRWFGDFFGGGFGFGPANFDSMTRWAPSPSGDEFVWVSESETASRRP